MRFANRTYPAATRTFIPLRGLRKAMVIPAFLETSTLSARLPPLVRQPQIVHALVYDIAGFEEGAF